MAAAPFGTRRRQHRPFVAGRPLAWRIRESVRKGFGMANETARIIDLQAYRQKRTAREAAPTAAPAMVAPVLPVAWVWLPVTAMFTFVPSPAGFAMPMMPTGPITT